MAVRWTTLNGAKGCKSVARHVALEDAGLGKEGNLYMRRDDKNPLYTSNRNH